MNMQVINSKAPGGFRPLTADEIMAVSGGGDFAAGSYDGEEIVVTAITEEQQTGALNRFSALISDISVSLGWSEFFAAGLTFYDNGLGVFVGVARPGPVISAGTAAAGDEAGWDIGADSALYQSGPLPIAGSEPVYYDPIRNDYYMAGDVWNEEAGMYLPPQNEQ